MSIRVTLNSYMDWASTTTLGCKFLDEPEFVQDALDELFDGQEFDENFDSSNPDNLYVNSYRVIDDQEMLDEFGNQLNYDSEHDDPAEFVETHYQEINECISDSYYYLGHKKGRWYMLQ